MEYTQEQKDKLHNEYITDCKIVGEYAGLIFQGIDDEGEPEFLGDAEQFKTYENVIGEEICWDDDEKRHYYMSDDGEDGYNKAYLN